MDHDTTAGIPMSLYRIVQWPVTAFHTFLDDALHSPHPSDWVKFFAALQYAVASLGIMFANKIVLTTYDFDSFAFLTLCQFATTCVLLECAKRKGWISFPDNDIQMFGRVFPLQLLFLVSTVCSLGGTKHISMPMFVMLRRFTIPMTMLAEYQVAGIKPPTEVVISVSVLCLGAMIAVKDFQTEIWVVGMILLANACQGLTSVVSKIKMDTKEGLGAYGLLMYNSLYSLMLFLPLFTFGPLHTQAGIALQHPGWGSPVFVLLFSFSCAMASILNFSLLLCTKVNSALSTMVVGVIKNLATTYLGMLIGDYTFSWMNFTGLNISVAGSLAYTYIKFQDSQRAQKKTSSSTAESSIRAGAEEPGEVVKVGISSSAACTLTQATPRT